MSKTSTTNMTLRYLFALGLLVAMSLAAYLVQRQTISEQNANADVVNVSGRQRMLSQQTAVVAHHLVDESNDVERAASREELLDAATSMERSHEALINGDPEMNLPGNPEAEVRALYFEAPLNVDSQVRRFVAEAKVLAAAPDAELTPDNPHQQYLVQNSPTLLNALDAVTTAYEKDSHTDIARLQRLQLGVLAAALFVLLMTGVFIFRPMVRRVREEKAKLQEAEAHTRAIVDTAADGIITIDERGAVQSFNRAAERIFGYAADEVIGRNVKMLMPSPYREEHDGYVANYLRTGEKKIIGNGREVVGRRKDGTTFPLDLAVSDVRLGDRRMSTGIVRDITERKRVEAELTRTSAELARSNAELEDFTYVVSHDLKEPLRGIEAFSGFLADDYRDRLDEEGRRYTTVLRESAVRMKNLIEDLLQLSRIGRSQQDYSTVAVESLLDDVRRDLQFALEEEESGPAHPTQSAHHYL